MTIPEHADPIRYHLLDERPVEVGTTRGSVLLGRGWLCITEIEYASLVRARFYTSIAGIVFGLIVGLLLGHANGF